jgi:hypothetical protein
VIKNAPAWLWPLAVTMVGMGWYGIQLVDLRHAHRSEPAGDVVLEAW